MGGNVRGMVKGNFGWSVEIVQQKAVGNVSVEFGEGGEEFSCKQEEHGK